MTTDNTLQAVKRLHRPARSDLIGEVTATAVCPGAEWSVLKLGKPRTPQDLSALLLTGAVIITKVTGAGGEEEGSSVEGHGTFFNTVYTSIHSECSPKSSY